MLPIFNISLIGRVDARRRARSERPLRSGQRLLYRLVSGLGLMLVLVCAYCSVCADHCDSGPESMKMFRQKRCHNFFVNVGKFSAAFTNYHRLRYHCIVCIHNTIIDRLIDWQTVHCSHFVAAANNVPFITVNGNGSLTRQWNVTQQNSVTFSTNDSDNEAVIMHGWRPLPSGSTLTRVSGSNLWEFVWTPVNMDPVELMWVELQQTQFP